MDYKYIEQLLQRYWLCETTLEEEQILRSFFSQTDIPAELQQYAPLFQYTAVPESIEGLGEDFDMKMMEMTGNETGLTIGRTTNWWQGTKRIVYPFFKAAAVIAVVITVGTTAQHVADRNAVSPDEPSDTYIRQENISARIKVIDQKKSDAIAQADSTAIGDKNEDTNKTNNSF